MTTPPPPTPAPYYAPGPRTNGLAIAALVLGLLGFGLLPVIFGHVALGQIKRTGEGGSGLALAGLILGYLGLIATILIVIFAVAIPLIAVGASGGFSS